MANAAQIHVKFWFKKPFDYSEIEYLLESNGVKINDVSYVDVFTEDVQYVIGQGTDYFIEMHCENNWREPKQLLQSIVQYYNCHIEGVAYEFGDNYFKKFKFDKVQESSFIISKALELREKQLNLESTAQEALQLHLEQIDSIFKEEELCVFCLQHHNKNDNCQEKINEFVKNTIIPIPENLSKYPLTPEECYQNLYPVAPSVPFEKSVREKLIDRYQSLSDLPVVNLKKDSSQHEIQNRITYLKHCLSNYKKLPKNQRGNLISETQDKINRLKSWLSQMN